MNMLREESVIFNELAELCSRPGYSHVIAFFCFRSNVALISEGLTPEIIVEQHSPENLIRTEISTLIGLLVKNEIDLALPTQTAIQSMINQTEALLSELHCCLTWPMRSCLEYITSEKNVDSFGSGAALREPIFYGGESAYDFQYLDFSRQKYEADNAWLLTNKGFGIDDAENLIRNIIEIQQSKMLNHLGSLRDVHPDNWTMLPAFIITKEELVNQLNIDFQVIDNILSAFCLPMDNRNDGFTALNDFNITNACPLITLDNDQYLLFQHYCLAEALYESPFYWMNDDKKYLNNASENRGNFVEKFSVKKFRNVFGYHRVFSGIDIYDPRKPNAGERGEIDVLVIFGDRAIVLQAKSKRLTINAKKGNDNAIKSDFQAAIQDSYNQGLLCAKLLNDPNYILVDSDSNKINIARDFKEIYIFCLIPDHYPALSFQARQFLHWEETENIKPPLVLDIFCLDVITEMLQSPLCLLSYINRRINYTDKILAHHEITILSFFMKHNPWLEDDQFVSLDDGVSSDIDSAMAVRRLGMPGKSKPDGILTRLASSRLGKILKMIDKSEESVTIDLGFLLLTLGQNSIEKIEIGLEKILLKSRSEHCSSDLSISIGKKETGLTVHSNNRPAKEAMGLLRGHCEMRKYIEKAKSWYGLCIHPDNGGLRFVIKAEYPWVHSSDMDRLIEQNQKRFKAAVKGKDHRKSKIGVNERCPCGSGLKYKKCCK